MKVKQLIDKLLNYPMHSDVVIDTDDGMSGNFQELKYAVEKKELGGRKFCGLK